LAIAIIRVGAVAAGEIDPKAVQQIRALLEEKAARNPAQRKMGSHLIYADKMRRHVAIAAGVRSLKTHLRSDGANRVLVDVRVTDNDAVSAQIDAAGGEVVSSFSQYHSIRAWLPLAEVEGVAGGREVLSVRPAAQPRLRKLTTSEGDVAHRASLARSTFNVNGAGVKIGVLSDSVDHLAAVQGSGDVGSVTVLPGRSGAPGTGEGTALLEVVFDLAPGASLYFATANGGDAGMADSIRALRDAGCDILVDDIGYFDEPVFQDGIIAQAVDAVSDSGALYFSAAGNGGNKDSNTAGAWEGNFVSSGSTLTYHGDVETLHNFGTSTLDTIAGQPLDWITLQWSDPFGASANDYDLFLIKNGSVIAASTDPQNGVQDPMEGINVASINAVGSGLAIVRYSGADRYLHLDTNGGLLAVSTAGAIWGHPTAATAIAVGAVSAAGKTTAFTSAAPIEFFSSDGPRRIFFTADGTPITPGNFLANGGSVRQKPDMAAADGVKVSASGFNPFYGTSAAAPHAAAIAALVKSANPSLSAPQIRAALASTALDIGAAGIDRDSGAGLLDAFAAVQAVIGASSATPSPTPTPTVSPSATVSPTPTSTATGTPSPSLTGTRTPTANVTATRTTTSTWSPTATASATSSATVTLSLAPSMTPSASATASGTLTSSPTASPTVTATESATVPATTTNTPTPSMTSTMSPTQTVSVTSTPPATTTMTPTELFTATVVSTTITATAVPTVSTTATVSPTLTQPPTVTATWTSTASVTGTETSTTTASPTPSSTSTPTQTATFSSAPTASPTDTATATPTNTLTATPTDTATASAPITSPPTQAATPTSTSSPLPTGSATATATDASTETPVATATPTAPATSTESPSPSMTMLPTSSPTPPSPTATPSAVCVGDCSHQGLVTVDNLVLGVDIALGSQQVDACAAFDANGDGRVTVDELVAAVGNALHGCRTTL